MHFELNEKSQALLERLDDFMRKRVDPLERDHHAWTLANPWQVYPRMAELKAAARQAGLWNLYLPPAYGEHSPGLTNLEYAPLAERMGRVLWASEVFNCNAPDTGNMEVLAKYGTPAQQSRWLAPLLAGDIRSAFLMTEPEVASSDATNIATRIERDGDEYIVSGRKWWSTGAMHPACKIAVVMGKTDPTAERHRQQSMILVPMDTPGLEIVRPLDAFGTYDSPFGHAEIQLTDVRVPAENLILGPGRGFEIAQGRLGPGRIHHCMRLIGAAQRSLELMATRVGERVAFGRPLAKFSSIRQDLAQSACEIEQARLLTLKAADVIDRRGIKAAKDLVAMIKIVAPAMAGRVIDRAIQAHGGLGVSSDLPLAAFWTYARCIRLADGPDEVHAFQLGREIARRYGSD